MKNNGITNTKQILFLSANPRGYEKLKLIEECKKISDRIRSATYGNRFQLVPEYNVSVQELQELVTIRYKPQVIHFAGHGERGSLLFQDEKGRVEEAKLKPFIKIFKALKERPNVPKYERVCLIVLSACYSERIAEALTEFVDCVIGMSNAIGDDPARIFGETLYFNLCSGASVKEACFLARNQVELLGKKGQDIPKLKTARDVDDAQFFLTEAEPVSAVHIYNALNRYFTTEFDLKILCSRLRQKGLDELRLGLAKINAPDVQKMLFHIIEYCETRGKISALISSALEERPSVTELIELAKNRW